VNQVVKISVTSVKMVSVEIQLVDQLFHHQRKTNTPPKSLLNGQNLTPLKLFQFLITKNYQLLKSKLMNLTCLTLPNILMDSGINSDSDHQSECQLMKREELDTVSPVLPKETLIVPLLTWETELFPYSSKLGINLKNQPILLVLMILEDNPPMNVKKFHSNTPMLMVNGSMSIMVSLLSKTKSIQPLSVKTTTKLLPFLMLLIMLHLLDYSLTWVLLLVMMLSMVTSIMLNSNMITLPLLETNKELDLTSKTSLCQTYILDYLNHNQFKLPSKIIPLGDQSKEMIGMVFMMVLSNGPPTVGLESKVFYNQ
jgi:hypothetical protein